MIRSLSAQAFKDQFLGGKYPPLLLWIGEDDYLKTEALAWFKRNAPKNLKVEVFSADEESPSEVLARTATPSLLDANTLLVLLEVERYGSSERAFLKRYAEKPLSEFHVILVASAGFSINDPFLHNLMKHAVVVEFQPLQGEALISWAKNKAQEFGLEIAESAFESLLPNGFAGHLSCLASEIEKLSLLSIEGRVPVSQEVIGEVLKAVSREANPNISQPFRRGHLRESLKAWKHQRLWGVKPEATLSGLLSQAVNFPEVEDNLEALYAVDLSLKSETISDDVIMPLMIAQVVCPALTKKEENRYGRSDS